MLRRRLPLSGLLAAALLAAGCGGSATPPIVTNPAGGGGGGGSSPSSTGSSSGSAKPGTTAAGGVRTVLVPLGLNLHTAPAKEAPVIGGLGEGTTVTVVSHSGDHGGWYQVKGSTQTGWITDDPAFTSPRQFSLYTSDERGFNVLYPTTWTFEEQQPGVRLRPQSGPQVVTIGTAPTLDALGPPGRPGYSVVSGDSVVVFGVTGTLRLFDHAGGAPPSPTPQPGASPTPKPEPQLPHLAEIRLAVPGKPYAMRIDFDYKEAADLDVFRDIYNSMYIAAAAVAPPPPPAPPPLA